MGVATTIAAGGSLIGAGLSYRQAANQSKVAAKARVASDKLIADARKKSEKDYYEGLNVPLDAYGEQFAQNMANQQQTIQALQEGDTRNLIGGVQGLTAAAAAANEQTRIGLGQELYANRQMKADSKQNINQQQLQMDIGQAADQQLMARDAEQASTAATQSAISGVVSAGLTIGEGMDLYGKTKPAKDAEDIMKGINIGDIPLGMSQSDFRKQLINLPQELREKIKSGEYSSEEIFSMVGGFYNPAEKIYMGGGSINLPPYDGGVGNENSNVTAPRTNSGKRLYDRESSNSSSTSRKFDDF